MRERGKGRRHIKAQLQSVSSNRLWVLALAYTPMPKASVAIAQQTTLEIMTAFVRDSEALRGEVIPTGDWQPR